MLVHTNAKAAVTIPEARAMLGGIAQATIYRLIDNGNLKTFRIGRRRLVGVNAIHDYIARAERENDGDALSGIADADRK